MESVNSSDNAATKNAVGTTALMGHRILNQATEFRHFPGILRNSAMADNCFCFPIQIQIYKAL